MFISVTKVCGETKLSLANLLDCYSQGVVYDSRDYIIGFGDRFCYILIGQSIFQFLIFISLSSGNKDYQNAPGRQSHHGLLFAIMSAS